jgi:hypothetical protein
MDGFMVADCEKIGGRVDPERGCVLDPISYGEPSWLYGETKSRAGWLPLDVLKKFWLSDFARSSADREQAMRELKESGVKEVEGSIHLPLETGRYSQLYSHKSIIFVPVIHERDSDRFVRFQPVAMRVLVPLDVILTVKER